MNRLAEFRSDWSAAFQKAWDLFAHVGCKSPDEWTSSEWKRLVDLCSLSYVPETETFHSLGLKLRRERCVPDKATLVRIGNWKAYGRIRELLKEKNKKSKTVKETSREAFEMIRQEASIKGSTRAIECLRDGIKDLGIPMASAILTMYDPLNFGVIDSRVWSTLFRKKTSRITSYGQWERYLCEIRRLAKLHQMKCREIDAALWFVGSQNARSRTLNST
jgi:hypothetical protein